MSAIVETAGEVKVIDMGARHFPPELEPRIGIAAAVGGAVGTSTRAAYAEVHARFGIGGEHIRIGAEQPREFRLYGTIPHSLNAVYNGSSVESAAAYRDRHPKVPLVVLLDFEGRERDVIAEAVQRFHVDLFGVRLDVPGNRIHQGGHDKRVRALEMRILSQVKDRLAAMAALDRYGFGPGVTIESAFATRDLLDSLNAKHVKIIVSSGFNLDKVRAFKACNAPMDFIGTGSWIGFSMFTSDIMRVWENGAWVPRCKAGRAEELHEPADMPVLLKT
jgi:nicotinic acid phosphoribosyltransferase